MIKPHQIGIDLGGTKTELILFSPRGEELYRKRISTPGKTSGQYAAVLASVVALVHETADYISDSGPFTVGVGIPGTVNNRTGLVQNANLTCLTDRPFKSDLENKLGRPVAMDNDANCFVHAFEQFLDDFGRSLGGLISILDPDAVVIGGGAFQYRGTLYMWSGTSARLSLPRANRDADSQEQTRRFRRCLWCRLDRGVTAGPLIV